VSDLHAAFQVPTDHLYSPTHNLCLMPWYHSEPSDRCILVARPERSLHKHLHSLHSKGLVRTALRAASTRWGTPGPADGHGCLATACLDTHPCHMATAKAAVLSPTRCTALSLCSHVLPPMWIMLLSVRPAISPSSASPCFHTYAWVLAVCQAERRPAGASQSR
jgi:hypothetical protein